jgi:hypothetical protein
MREDALDWVKEQEERRERRQCIMLVAADSGCRGGLVGGFGPSHKPTLATNNPLLKATPNGLGTMPNGKSTKRRQDLGSSLTAGRSRDHI